MAERSDKDDRNAPGNQDPDALLARRTRDWQSMIRITHDFFHGWRRTVAEAFGEDKAMELELRFYESVGAGTARMFADRGGRPEDVEKLVFSLVRASEVMGEKARMERDGGDWLLIHEACPWPATFRANGVPHTCQASCDHWFRTTARSVSPTLDVVTESALPAGDATCTRRFVAAA